jgi:hypothetical protein
MRNHTPPLYTLDPLGIPLNQPLHRMKCAPHLERANPLEVLTLEEQLDLRLCRFLPFPWRPLQRIGSLRRRREIRQCRIGLHWREMYMRFDEFVGGDDGVARQGEGDFCATHFEGCMELGEVQGEKQ